MGRVLLTRCALETAVLVAAECPLEAAFLTDPANAAYHRLLTGETPRADDLPKRYRSFAGALAEGATPAVTDAVSRIEDPVSRLVAVGIAFRRGLADTALLEVGAATSSAQGWKRPLTAYLLRLKERYTAAGDTAGAAAVEARFKTLDYRSDTR